MSNNSGRMGFGSGAYTRYVGSAHVGRSKGRGFRAGLVTSHPTRTVDTDHVSLGFKAGGARSGNFFSHAVYACKRSDPMLSALTDKRGANGKPLIVVRRVA